MLSYLDPILFPDECEVLEVAPNRYVYSIFKNGSSSLRKSNFRRLNSDEIAELTDIEVFVREPFERYVSGVQTYLQHNSHLDRTTTLTMIDEYLFLNRHFALQFHWIMNLMRFNPGVQMTIRPVSELESATDLTWNAIARDKSLLDYFSDNEKLKFYLMLDRILLDFIGHTVKFSTIVEHVKVEYPVLYEETIERVKDLCAVLD